MSHFGSLVFISYIHEVSLVASDVEIQVKSKYTHKKENLTVSK